MQLTSSLSLSCFFCELINVIKLLTKLIIGDSTNKYVQDEEYFEEDIVQDSQGTSEFTQEEDEEVTEDDYYVYADVMQQEAGISETLSESTFQEGQKKCSSTRHIVYTLYNKNTT